MHKSVFTPENAAMLLIDHQTGTMSWTHSHDVEEVKKNALQLAKIATAVDMPLVLTSSMEVNVQGPLVPELEQIAPQAFTDRKIISELAVDWTTPRGQALGKLLGLGA